MSRFHRAAARHDFSKYPSLKAASTSSLMISERSSSDAALKMQSYLREQRWQLQKCFARHGRYRSHYHFSTCWKWSKSDSFAFGSSSKLLSATFRSKTLHHLVGRIVVKLNLSGEPALQTRIGCYEVGHLVGISGHNHHKPVTIALMQHCSTACPDRAGAF